MSVIINPAAEKQARDAVDARIMDEKNLARNIFIQSFAREHGSIGVAQAFDLAHEFMAEQTLRFPKNDTFDGRSQG